MKKQIKHYMLTFLMAFMLLPTFMYAQSDAFFKVDNDCLCNDFGINPM